MAFTVRNLSQSEWRNDYELMRNLLKLNFLKILSLRILQDFINNWEYNPSLGTVDEKYNCNLIVSLNFSKFLALEKKLLVLLLEVAEILGSDFYFKQFRFILVHCQILRSH